LPERIAFELISLYSDLNAKYPKIYLSGLDNTTILEFSFILFKNLASLNIEWPYQIVISPIDFKLPSVKNISLNYLQL
jgi:hypothetical protein